MYLLKTKNMNVQVFNRIGGNLLELEQNWQESSRIEDLQEYKENWTNIKQDSSRVDKNWQDR